MFFVFQNNVEFQKLVRPSLILCSLQSDMGITLSADPTGGVAAWADQSNKQNDFSQGLVNHQPTYNASGLNGIPTVSFDGSSDFLSNTALNLSVPCFFWLVMKETTWTSNRAIFGDHSSTNMRLVQNPSSPGVRLGENLATKDVTPSVGLGSWFRVEASYTNSTADYIKAGSASATGTNLGTTGTTGLDIGGINNGALLSNVEIAAFMVFSQAPSSSELAALAAAAQRKYGKLVAT